LLEVAQHVGQVRLDELCDLHDLRQLAVSCPEVPTVPELARPCGRLVAPELAQALLDGPRPCGPQFEPPRFLRRLLRLRMEPS
jgi:hypothetical protein